MYTCIGHVIKSETLLNILLRITEKHKGLPNYPYACTGEFYKASSLVTVFTFCCNHQVCVLYVTQLNIEAQCIFPSLSVQ